jgi:hypothetical protein
MRYLTRADLRDAQKLAIPFVVENESCGVFADVGLGKCGIAIIGLDELYNRMEIDSILIIAPRNVTTITWPDELETWKSEHSFSSEMLWGAEPGVVTGSMNGERRIRFWRKKLVTLEKAWAKLDAEDDMSARFEARLKKAARLISNAKRTLKWGLAAARRPANIHLINRDNIFWLVNFWGKFWPYEVVIYDESSDLKNAQRVLRWRAMRKIRPYTKRFIEMTGTPHSKGLLDLWGQIFMLDGGKRLGKTFTEYKEQYFVSDYMGYSYKPRKGAFEEITKLISDITITLEAKDFLDLPPTIFNQIPVALESREMKIYHRFEKDYVVKLVDGVEIDALSASALQMKLLQLANGLVYDREGKEHQFHTAKLDAVENYISEQQGKNVLLGYFFKHDRKALAQRFPSVVEFSKKVMPAWNRGEIPLMMVHPQSAGHGINIQFGGRRILWYGPIPTQDLELWLQLNGRLADARAVGLGTTYIDTLICKGTADEIAQAALEGKDASQRLFKAAMKKLRHESQKESV